MSQRTRRAEPGAALTLHEMHIALVISPRCAATDDESPVLAETLQTAGPKATCVAWYDSSHNWTQFDAVVVRTPWDIYQSAELLEEFDNWLTQRSAHTTVLNPPATIRWSLDKRYLTTLPDRGVATVPTQVIEVGEHFDAPTVDYVVKPVTAAGSRDAAWYKSSEADRARAHVDMLHRSGRAALVQPFIESIHTQGERSLVFFGDQFSHAIKKQLVLQPGAAHDADKIAHPSPERYEPTDAELDVAQRALALVPDPDGARPRRHVARAGRPRDPRQR